MACGHFMKLPLPLAIKSGRLFTVVRFFIEPAATVLKASSVFAKRIPLYAKCLAYARFLL